MAKHRHSHRHGHKQPHSHGHNHHGDGHGGQQGHHSGGQHGDKNNKGQNGGGQNQGNGGNNGGGGGGGGGKDKKGYELPSFLQDYLDRNQGDIADQAARQVDLALKPYLNQIDLEQTQAKQQYGQDVTRAKSIYQGLQNDLAPLDNQYNAAAKDIGSNLQDSLGALAQDIPTGGFGQENKAYSDAYGAAGASALGVLASDQARNAAYQAGDVAQGAAEQSDAQANFLGQLQDAQDQFAQRRADVMSQAPEMTQSRLDDLTQQALEGNLSVQQFLLNAKQARNANKSNNALSNFLMKQIGDQGSGSGSKNTGNKNPGGGKPNNQNPGGKNPGNGPGGGNNNNGGGNGGGQSVGGGSTGGSPGRGHSGDGSGHHQSQGHAGYANALGPLFQLANGASFGSLPNPSQALVLDYIKRFSKQHPGQFGGNPRGGAHRLLRQLTNPLGIGGSVGNGPRPPKGSGNFKPR
jgi:hypothetical protein